MVPARKLQCSPNTPWHVGQQTHDRAEPTSGGKNNACQVNPKEEDRAFIQAYFEQFPPMSKKPEASSIFSDKSSENAPFGSDNSANYGGIQRPIGESGKMRAVVANRFIALSSPQIAPPPTPQDMAPISSPKISKPAIAFGAAEWAKYFGEVGVEPPLPPDIDQILDSPCPFHPGESIGKTHLFTLIPATVDGKPLTLDLLGNLIENPREGTKTKYRFYNERVQRELGRKAPAKSYRMLMTKDLIPGSRHKVYPDQIELVESYKENSKKPYELPGALEVAASILMEYVRTGKSLYTDNELDKRWTYTRCKERIKNNRWSVAVGGLGTEGLDVSHIFDYSYDSDGVAGVWKL